MMDVQTETAPAEAAPLPDAERLEPVSGEVIAPAPKPQRERAQLVGGKEILAIIPRNLEEAMRLAAAMIAAGIVPESYNYPWDHPEVSLRKTPDRSKVLIGILKSLEVGLPPITGISTIAVINNRPSIYGDGAMALIQNSGFLEKHETRLIGGDFDMEDPEALPLSQWPMSFGYEVKLWRRQQETPWVGRYTVGDAKRAGLWFNPKKKPWLESPKRMLFIRARAFPQRDGFADALCGLSIAEEVRDHMPDEDRTPIRTGFLSSKKPEAAAPVAIEDQRSLDQQIGETAEKVFADADATAARVEASEAAHG